MLEAWPYELRGGVPIYSLTESPGIGNLLFRVKCGEDCEYYLELPANGHFKPNPLENRGLHVFVADQEMILLRESGFWIKLVGSTFSGSKATRLGTIIWGLSMIVIIKSDWVARCFFDGYGIKEEPAIDNSSIVYTDDLFGNKRKIGMQEMRKCEWYHIFDER